MKKRSIYCPWHAQSAFWWVLVCICAVRPASAQPKPLARQLEELLQSAHPVAAKTPLAAGGWSGESARMSLTADGHLSYLGAPPGRHFKANAAGPGNPEQTARNFLREHGPLFGSSSRAVDFALLKHRAAAERHYVRFQQTYGGVPVYGAKVTVQVDLQDGVECVFSDMEGNSQLLDAGRVSVIPTVSSAEALAAALALCKPKTPRAVIKHSQPELLIFAPSVLGAPGDPHLAWKVEVYCDTELSLNRRFLLDAHSKQVLRKFPLAYSSHNREIYDAHNADSDGDLVRSEGDGPTGDSEVDNAYIYFGDVYWFYQSNHDWDSFNGDGCTMEGTVRYCDPDHPCPWANAMYRSMTSPWCTDDRFYFGQGWAAQEVVAHEYTHGVTDHTSDLDYENTSGAINESLSDVWGEFVDLTFFEGAGDNDDPSVRWLVGEDVAGYVGRGFRNMRDPTSMFDPDRLGSPLYRPAVSDPDEDNDWGGVHANSGVNNKLCYLLTDGDTFNGQTVYGMGILAVARLYWEAQYNLLTDGSDWSDLSHALAQAAVNLNWSHDDYVNLRRACVAVEIASRLSVIYVEKDNSCTTQNGLYPCLPGWGGPYPTVTRGVSEAWIKDTLFILTGSYPEALTIDKPLIIRAFNGPVTIGP